MEFANPYWSMAIKIGCLQRYILVHSYLYYELNTSIISDKKFDENAYQLVDMQKEDPSEAKRSQYWYVFDDFDGTTGFDLYHRLNKADKERIQQVANHVLGLHQREGGSISGKDSNSRHRH